MPEPASDTRDTRTARREQPAIPHAGDPGMVIDLRSSAVADDAPIPATHAMDGDNVPPDLMWQGVPEGTHELAVTCIDLDAPDGPFLHWLVTGIDPMLRALDATAGREHRNGFGESGWGGPLPPEGDEPHRYVVRVHALDEEFDETLDGRVGPGEGADDVPALTAWLDEHSLATGMLTGVYQR